jgi:lipoic acid synthetase
MRYNAPMSREPNIRSGEKFVTAQGFNAIKDGMKHARATSQTIGRKPQWLRVRIPGGGQYAKVHGIVRQHTLSTVCEESHCPNIAECWSAGTATIMVMGSVCTRACRFCAVDTGNPQGWLDPNEPANAAQSVQLMGLRYVVITSVDRDDLDDGGAAHYAACIRAIKARNPETSVEALTPDFGGRRESVATVVAAGLEVFAQNLETVERLTHIVRDPRAGYQQTLEVLAMAKDIRPDVLTKTSLLLGVGERDDELKTTMDDLRAHGVDVLTLGQYLRPTPNHLDIARWVHPDEFARYREWGLQRGFLEVASGPLVRSSYRAERVLERSNLGLSDQAIPTTQL